MIRQNLYLKHSFSPLLTLSMLAVLFALSSCADNFQLSDWNVTLNDDCSFGLSHPLNQNAFVSLPQLLSTGRSNLDNITIIKNGDIQAYPNETTQTIYYSCNETEVKSNQVVRRGLIQDNEQSFYYQVTIETTAISSNNIKITFLIEDTFDSKMSDYLKVNFESNKDEEIYGMGLQYTVWNFKGLKVPVISSEGGVGRGLEPLTSILNDKNDNQGGNNMTTYAPSYTFISNQGRGMVFNTSFIGYADYTQNNSTSFLFWHAKKLEFYVFVGKDFKDLVSELTLITGRMRPIPSWIQQGIVLGLQGGQETVEHNYQILKENGVPVVAIWMQDWVGTKSFPEGVRLMWNWKLNKQFYPNWDDMVQRWKNDSVRTMIYINPYFANLTDISIERNLFIEGDTNGYFVKNKQNQTYLMKSVSIEFAMVDFTNPGARQWIKSIIVDNLIKEGQAHGWMLDFGEYTPFDIVTYTNEDPYEYHNAFPYEWAKVNREAEQEVEYGDEIVAFMRSGQTFSSQYCDLFWMGDQLPTYDQYDGYWSALIGLLNGGLSGFSQGHSDIGGYTSLKDPYDIHRDKQVLQRWIELNTFSDVVMRTHPSNKPVNNYQIYSDNDTAQFTAKFVKIHQALADYKRELINESVTLGWPLTRPLMFEYPEDKNCRAIKDQFMLGSELLAAPVVFENATSREVYLPEGRWVHIWTKQAIEAGTEGIRVTVNAEIGRPPVFIKESGKLQWLPDKAQEIFGIQEKQSVIGFIE